MPQKTPPVTAALIAINLAVFVADHAYSGNSFLTGGISPFARDYWLSAPDVIQGSYWQLFTAAFLHANLLHIGMNMLALWQMGPMAELIFGSRRFLFIYLIAAVLGNGVSLFWKGIVPGSLGTPSLGASGAVFGVMGAFLAIVWIRSRSREEFLSSPQVKQTGMNLLLLFILGMSAGIGIDHFAHFGGLFAGGASAVIFSRLRVAPQKKQSALLVLILALGMTLYGAYPIGSKALKEAELYEREKGAQKLFEIGATAFNTGDFATAEQQFTEVLKVDPMNPPALYNLYLSQRNQNKIADAVRTLEILENILDQNPNLDRENSDGFVSLKQVKEQLTLLRSYLKQ